MSLQIEILNLYSLHNRRKEANLLYNAKFKELEAQIIQQVRNGAEVFFGEDYQFFLDKDGKLIFRKIVK